MLNSYEDYQDAISTEKITLAVVEPAIRLMGFYLAGGSIYSLSNFDVSVIVSIKDSGVQLTSVSSFGALVSGSFFNDRNSKTLYVWTVDSAQPNGKFIVCTFRQYYSNIPITLPNDFASGTDVDFLPYIKSTSSFGVELDNKNQLGFAIEGSGSIAFINEQDYWKSRFDKWTWENKRVQIYSYARALPASEAKLIFNGFIQKKSWSLTQVSFSVKDIIANLKNEFILENIEDYVGAVTNEGLKLAKQRKVYGYVYGHVPTPIDMVVNGFYGSGTINTTFGDTIITGTGTSFLSELSPGDEILVDDFDEYYSVDEIQSDTQFTLSEPWGFATRFNKPYQIKPTDEKRYKNRVFLVAGHATKEPVTTVVKAWSLNYLELSNTSELRVGDKIKVGFEYVFIRRISGSFVKLRTNLVDLPDIGEVITRPSLSEVYIASDKLSESDYSYDAATGVLTLTDLAEFNVAPVQTLIGTNIAFTNGSRNVVGVGTKFSSQINPGDWIRPEDQAEYFEVLQVIDDENLQLRTPSTYTFTDNGLFKAPKYYKEGTTVLSCDLIGKTKNGLKTGAFIGTASEIVEDVLKDSGLGSYINAASFTAAKEMAPQLVSMVVPKKMSDKTTQKIRDVIGDISESVFGSLIQTNDFQLAFNILSPERSLADKKFTEKDILDFSIDSDSSKLIKTAIVNYLYKEYDYLSLNATNKKVEFTPDENEFLQQSVLVTTFESKLVLEKEADTLAQRFSLVLQLSRASVNFKTKLQASRLSANERVWLSHEKLYERVGTTLNQKISAVSSINKSGSNSEVEIDDLSGTFSRCGTVTENTADEYDDATQDDKMVNGFITDNYGMMPDNQADTFGVNIIW